MRLPEIRARITTIVAELVKLEKEIKRRPSVRRAKPTSRRMTVSLRQEIKRYAMRRPAEPFQKIADRFGVNPGRVSEAVRGKRT